jgi:hypothetical protein
VPPAPLLITTPYDIEARFSTKRETSRVGDTVHLTEPCDPDHPHRLTDVTTPPATTADMAMPGQIPQQVAARGLLPADHPVDAGSVCGEPGRAPAGRRGRDWSDTTGAGLASKGGCGGCGVVRRAGLGSTSGDVSALGEQRVHAVQCERCAWGVRVGHGHCCFTSERRMQRCSVRDSGNERRRSRSRMRTGQGSRARVRRGCAGVRCGGRAAAG